MTPNDTDMALGMPSPSASDWANAEPEETSNWRINRWAEFRDPSIEQGYRSAMLGRDRWQSVAGMAVGLVCCLLFMTTDRWWVSDPQALALLTGLRMGIMGFTLFAIVALIQGDARRYDPLVTAWLVLVIGALVVINATRPAHYLGHVAFDLIVLCGIYAVFVSRFRLQLMIGLGYTAVMALSLTLWRDLQTPSGPALLASLLGVNLMGITLTWRLHWLGRRQFALLLREREWGRQLHRLAHLDPLTEIPNRREFMHSAAVEMERFRRHGRPVALVLFDLDHFKRVNDRFGHETGDGVLQAFAAILEQEARGLDVPARLGGEEFVVLLPETDRNGAFNMAQRVQQRTRDLRFGPENQGRCTVSAGITEARAGDSSVDDLLSRSDRALYDAKFDGRDRIATDLVTR